MTKKKVLVADNGGLYLQVAIAMTRWFDVYYYNRWESEFPYLGAKVIGDGFPGITKIDSIDDYQYHVDIIIFPDIYYAPMANRLRSDGIKVWGSGDIEYVERDRDLFMEELEKCGLPLPETKSISGLNNLIEYLDDKKDLWIKISEYRGMCETFHWISKEYTEYFIDCVKNKFGPYADDEKMKFQVQAPIKTVLEYGSDMWLVNGQNPPKVVLGFEDKGKGYFGKIEDFDSLPSGLKNVNEKFEKTTKKYKYTGFYSNEVRVPEKGEDLFIDICPRGGNPPTSSMLYIGDNWDKIIEAGVIGKIEPIKSRFKYVAEVIIYSDYEGWNPIKYDKKYEEHIMPSYCCMRDGILMRIPNNQLYCASQKVCSVVHGGDTVEEAITKATEIASTIEGISLSYEPNILQASEKIIESLRKETNYKY